MLSRLHDGELPELRAERGEPKRAPKEASREERYKIVRGIRKAGALARPPSELVSPS